MKKQYQYNQVIYGFRPSYRKWSFQVGSFEFITPCINGVKSAVKIARLIDSSFQRTGALDVLAKNNINRLAWS